MKDTLIIVCAAGSSSRLGKPKQLLSYKSSTLLQNTINQCQLVNESHPIVILGSAVDQIKETINESVEIIINEEWASGMSSSIVTGLKAVDLSKFGGCVVTVADQPFLSHTVLEQLIAKGKKHNSIIQSKYLNGQGPPSYFPYKYFNELKQLNGQQGAKPLIALYHKDVMYIEFPEGEVDIDTEADLKYLDVER